VILFPTQKNTGDPQCNNSKYVCVSSSCRILVAVFTFIICLNTAIALTLTVDPQEKNLRTELAKVEKQFGRNTLETIKSRSNLALYLSDAKRYSDSIPLFLQQLKIIDKYWRRLPPGTPPSSLAETTNFMLAAAYQMTGDYDKAIHHYLRTLEILEKLPDSEKLNKASILGAIGFLYEHNEKYEDAIQIYQHHLTIENKIAGTEDLDTANTLFRLCELNIHNGKYSEALSYCFRSLPIYERIHGHDHIDVARNLSDIGVIYLRMDKTADAYVSLQAALTILEKLGLADDQRGATVINNLAMISLGYGFYDDAISLFQRSLDISEKAADKSSIATPLANLSEAYRDQGQFDKALPLAMRALEILDKFDGKIQKRATAMNNLGLIFEAQGNYSEALIYFQQSLHLLEGTLGKNHPDLATPLNNLSRLYNELNDTPKALALAERSLAICEQAFGEGHRTTAGVINTVAVLYSKSGNQQKALALFKRSLAILEKTVGLHDPMAADVQVNIAVRLMDDGKIDEALAMYQKALTSLIVSFGQDHPDLINILNNMSDAYSRKQNFEKAYFTSEWAYRIAAQTASPVHWKALLNLAGAESFYGNRDAAIYFAKQGINALQDLRSSVSKIGIEEQKSFFSDKDWYYETVADMLIQEGRIPEAQQIIAMLKEEEYFDFILRDAGSDTRKTRATNTQREALWANRYTEISSQLVALGSELDKLNRRAKMGLSPEEEGRRIKLETDQKKGRQAFDDYMNDLSTETSKAGPKREADLAGVGKENLDQLRSTLTSLGHGAVLLQYIVTDKHVSIILTTPQVQLAREVVISSGELVHKIRAFHQVLNIRNHDLDPRPQAQALYQLLIAPIAEDLKQAHAETLMLSLDGSLRYLPMDALYDGKSYLIEKYPLVMYTELAKDNLREKPKAQWKVAGLGTTRKLGEFAPLPSVRQELEGIINDGSRKASGGALPGDIYLDKDFTEARLHDVLTRAYPVVHIASHFNFSLQSDAQSFLLLGDGKQLSLAELRTGGWKFDSVDMMTLSSCETALGGSRDANGREIEGFGALVQRQGAKGVLATLWKVADQSTAILMQTLYRLRQENGLTKAEALREAQLALINGKHAHTPPNTVNTPIPNSAGAVSANAPAYTPDPDKPFAHPYYWAPFILMGNWL